MKKLPDDLKDNGEKAFYRKTGHQKHGGLECTATVH